MDRDKNIFLKVGSNFKEYFRGISFVIKCKYESKNYQKRILGSHQKTNLMLDLITYFSFLSTIHQINTSTRVQERILTLKNYLQQAEGQK